MPRSAPPFFPEPGELPRSFPDSSRNPDRPGYFQREEGKIIPENLLVLFKPVLYVHLVLEPIPHFEQFRLVFIRHEDRPDVDRMDWRNLDRDIGGDHQRSLEAEPGEVAAYLYDPIFPWSHQQTEVVIVLGIVEKVLAVDVGSWQGSKDQRRIVGCELAEGTTVPKFHLAQHQDLARRKNNDYFCLLM